jgi:hypothetical protein
MVLLCYNSVLASGLFQCFPAVPLFMLWRFAFTGVMDLFHLARGPLSTSDSVIRRCKKVSTGGTKTSRLPEVLWSQKKSLGCTRI